jgi:two-component system sensor histidine kinase KdpD
MAVRWPAVLRLVGVAIPTLALATIATAILQDVLGVPNPSTVYLVAVVATAVVSGTAGAIATAVASFLLYNYLFTEPRYTLSMHEPGVWLSVILLLFVGVVVGQLAALQRARAELARMREKEARALFSVSRQLLTRQSVESVLADVASTLEAESGMSRIWITVGRQASSSAGPPAEIRLSVINQLERMPGDTPPQWARIHEPKRGQPRPTDDEMYRVAIESGGDKLGAIWGLRKRSAGPPNGEQTRLLAAAADQLGQAIAHDRMAAEANAAAVARESDALKSALLQSVSHDLRTPLATIRAAAGTLRPGDRVEPAVRAESVDAIEREVEYLNRLVTNLLDLSRIEAGVLHAAPERFEIDDLVASTLARLSPRLAGWQVANEAGAQLVEADPVFFDSVLTNVLENALRHTPAGTLIRLTTRFENDVAAVTLSIDDSGPGVPPEALGRLFDKFYRVADSPSARSGTGIGLAVARGLVESMAGQIAARPSDLGGLGIDITLATATMPAELASTVNR